MTDIGNMTTDDRTEARRAFLTGTDWANAPIRPLAADASFRAYYRVGDSPSAVLMDAPPGKEDVRPFLAVTHYLRGLGLSAPAVYHADIKAGFLLLEDLGDDRMSRRIAARPADETALYARAVDILAHIGTAPPTPVLPVPDGPAYTLPPYDLARLMDEAMLLPEWFIPAATGRPLDPAAVTEYRDLWSPLLAEVAEARHSMVLRDYHADNLMHLAERPDLAAMGLLDYQDAVLGHAGYDLVSLLEDARRDVPAELRVAMLERYMTRAEIGDQPVFLRHFDILGAQRNAKIIGIFARLSRRDGKPGYLPLIPRVWRLLEDDLDRLGAPGLTAWLDAHVPAAWRHRPLSAHVQK